LKTVKTMNAMARAAGFTLIELLVASAVLLALFAVTLVVLQAAPEAFGVDSERSDMMQRLRVAHIEISRDLEAAGAVRPYRLGASVPDAPGTFKGDTLTAVGSAGVMRTYWLKADDRAGVYQLMSYAGGASADVPVVDNVVGLAFEYFGDPEPPRMIRPLSDPTGPWTTYGPPPARGPSGPYVAGENCVFAANGTDLSDARLPALAPAGVHLVPLPAEQLTDGPWCPDDGAAERWDADLLRVRAIAVTLRVQAAAAWLRGPAGNLFAHGGTSGSARRWLPDIEVRFTVAPRTLNLGR
jgi:prepilin-type N-terminal cleavage/methylation domain-containing protein